MSDESGTLPQPSGWNDARPAVESGSITRYRILKRWQALPVLTILALAVVGGVSTSLGPPPRIGGGPGARDVVLYSAVVQKSARRPSLL